MRLHKSKRDYTIQHNYGESAQPDSDLTNHSFDHLERIITLIIKFILVVKAKPSARKFPRGQPNLYSFIITYFDKYNTLFLSLSYIFIIVFWVTG